MAETTTKQAPTRKPIPGIDPDGHGWDRDKEWKTAMEKRVADLEAAINRITPPHPTTYGLTDEKNVLEAE